MQSIKSESSYSSIGRKLQDMVSKPPGTISHQRATPPYYCTIRDSLKRSMDKLQKKKPKAPFARQESRDHRHTALSSHDTSPPPGHYSPTISKKVHKFSFELLPHGARMPHNKHDQLRERKDVEEILKNDCCGRLFQRQYQRTNQALRTSALGVLSTPQSHATLPVLHQNSLVNLKTVQGQRYSTKPLPIVKNKSVGIISQFETPQRSQLIKAQTQLPDDYGLKIWSQTTEKKNLGELGDQMSKMSPKKLSKKRKSIKSPEKIQLDHSMNLDEYLHPNMNFVHGIGSKELQGVKFEKWTQRPALINKLDNPNPKRFDPSDSVLTNKQKRVQIYKFEDYTKRKERLFEPTDMFGLDKLYDTSQKERFLFKNTGDLGSMPFQLSQSRQK